MAIPSDDVILKDYNTILSDAQDTGWKFWREVEVDEGYRFFNGTEQWDPSVRQNLLARGLKPITINNIPPFIKSVQGEVTRFSGEVHFFPNEGKESNGYSEVVNKGTEWVRNQASSDYYNKQVLQDALICGLGGVESIIDYEEDPDGVPRDMRVMPKEFLPDWNSTGVNLNNGRYIIRARYMTKQKFKEMFPDTPLPPEGEEGTSSTFTLGDLSQDQDEYETQFQLRPNYEKPQRNMILVFDFQFKEAVKFKRTMNPLVNEQMRMMITQSPLIAQRLQLSLEDADVSPEQEFFDLTTEQFNAFAEEMTLIGLPVEAQIITKYEYYRAWISKGKIIEKGDAPYKDKFSYTLLCTFWDDEKFCPYGYLRALKDPQKVYNSAFMHHFHSTLTSPKPSVFYESDAVEDTDEFERSVADRQAAVEVADGALRDGKIMPFNPPAGQTGFESLLTLSRDSYVSATGINMNFAGLDEQEISGILDRQRNEKSLTSIEDIVQNYHFFIKERGRTDVSRLAMLADGMRNRIVSILGKNGIERVSLLKDAFRLNYDVTIDEAKPSVTQRMETAKQLMELMKSGMIPQQTMPIVQEYVFENVGVPETALAAIRESMQQSIQAQSQQMQAQQEQDQIVRQITQQTMQADAMANEALAQERLASIAVKQADANKKFAESQQVEIENATILAGNVDTTNFSI